tara:strand:+ start:258 stop:1256 length:999 start_codon:yes stop_codon:yes gene_type:complete
MKTIIIAEAGVNHNGSLSNAIKLVDIAKESGADYVKFQLFDPSKLVTPKTRMAKYQFTNLKKKISQHQMLDKLILNKNEILRIYNHCLKRKIKFLATAFDIKNLEYLLKLGQDFIKIPSGEITNGELLEFVKKRKEKVILSTGASSIEDVKIAVKHLNKKNNSLILLHCNSAYPAKLNELNLKVISTYKKLFNYKVGYSDHSLSLIVPSVAVSLGASVIEKHFTIDRKSSGPDHKASLTGKELKDMIQKIRETEKVLGSNKKTVTRSERVNQTVIRRSIYANHFIKKGEVFTIKNLICLRPDNGISAIKWKDIIGKRAIKNFRKNEKIKIQK